MNIVKAKDISKIFGKNVFALKKVSLELKQGEVTVLMGPSGSGKSTLIRTFNALEKISSGYLEVLGIPINTEMSDKQTKKLREEVGMVFQQFNLFPHLSIIENITIAQIKVLKKSKIEANQLAYDLLDQMGIVDQAQKYPNQLSGGQQQRVAIARALALKPKIMLFDEPTSALDPERVKEVLDAMRSLAKRGMSMVIVSHEIKFAQEVADKVIFMDKGRIIETTTPEIFFKNAQHERSRKFLNQMM